MMASIPRRVKRAFGSLMSAAGVVGLIGLTFGNPAKKRLSRRLVALEKVVLDMPRAA